MSIRRTTFLGLALALIPAAQAAAATTIRSATATLVSQGGSPCISSVEIVFSAPVRPATLYGALRARNDYGFEKAFSPQSISQDLRTIRFETDAPLPCQSGRAYSSLTIAPQVRDAQGYRLSSGLSAPIRWPSAGARSLALAFGIENGLETEELALDEAIPEVGVAPNRLAHAIRRVLAWRDSEQRMSYRSSPLALIPLQGTILQPYAPLNRARHYGSPDLNYAIREAAVFVKELFPQLNRIGLADLSTSAGTTPRMSDGVYLHPEGSHMRGIDADVGYVENADGSIDLEKSFWLVYSLLERTGVDLVITAYKPQFSEYARRAFRAGLIPETVVARFDSARVQEDHELNHDKHLHVSLGNRQNGRSAVFEPSDNVYSCYIRLKPDGRGMSANFCSSPY